MTRRRRNTDDDLRALERAAAAGDVDARARLVRARLRAGTPGSITLAELAATPEADVLDVLRELPDELAGRWWRGWIARPIGRVFPAMTHDQIMQALDPSARNDYERAVQAEAEALATFRAGPGRRKRPASQYLEEVQGLYAGDVSDFLQNPSRTLEPHEIISNRRTPIAWATAERLRRAAREREERASGPPINQPGISGALARLFRAEIANEEHGGHAPATLDSVMDSIQQGYDTGHGDDMDAVLLELESLIGRVGGSAEARRFWEPGDPIPDREWEGVHGEQLSGEALDDARMAAANAVYETFQFDSPVEAADGWIWGAPNPPDTWRRNVYLENPGGDSSLVIFVVQFQYGTAVVTGASAE